MSPFNSAGMGRPTQYVLVCQSRWGTVFLARLCQTLQISQVSSRSNTGSIRDDPYWTSKKNSVELIELCSINKVSLV